MEEKELFYFQKAMGLLKMGMGIEILEKELAYFIASDYTAAAKGYQKAMAEFHAQTNSITS